MEFKFFGFWREQGNWQSPSILDFIGKGKPLDKKLEKQIENYLWLSADMSPTTLGDSYSILDGKPIWCGDVWFSDGKWVWRQDIWHYYKNHNIPFPDEFIADVKKAYRWTYPIFWLKMLYLRRNSHRIADKLDAFFQNSSNEITKDAIKKETLFGQNSLYKTSIILSVNKNEIKIPLSQYDWVKVYSYQENAKFSFNFVVENILEDGETYLITVNTLALDSLFFQQYLGQKLELQSLHSKAKKHLDNFFKARLEKIETKN